MPTRRAAEAVPADFSTESMRFRATERVIPMSARSEEAFGRMIAEAMRPTPGTATEEAEARGEYANALYRTTPDPFPERGEGYNDQDGWYYHTGPWRMRSRPDILYDAVVVVVEARGRNGEVYATRFGRDNILNSYPSPEAARLDSYARIWTPPDVALCHSNVLNGAFNPPPAFDANSDVATVRIDPALLANMSAQQRHAYDVAAIRDATAQARAFNALLESERRVRDRNGNVMLLDENGQEREDL